MNIKQKSILLFAFISGLNVHSQNIEEGIKLVKYERFESAKKILEPLSASNALANYYLGLAELGQENKEKARNIFSKYPTDPANIAGRARVELSEGKTAEGLALLNGITATVKKKDLTTLTYAADAMNYTNTNAQQAIDWYKKALEKTDNIDLRIGLGDAWQKINGGGGEAMNNYEAAIAKDTTNSLGYSRIGALWYDAKNYPFSLDNYAKAKNADPNNPLPYRDLANAYFWVGKYDLANQNIDKYYELSDKTENDKYTLANIKFLNKDYPSSIKIINDVLTTVKAPKPYMYRLLGYSQYETKDFTNALSNMKTFFAKQDPKKILVSDYIYYGKILNENKQIDAANENFMKAVSVDTSKDKSETYRLIADLYKDQKTETGYKNAGIWYAKIVDETPAPKVLDYFYAGLWNYYGSNYSGANKYFELMENKYSDQPSATYWRGRTAAAIDENGTKGTAVPFYNKWLAISDPSYTRKAADLIQAYRYLSIFYYNKGDKANMKLSMDKLEALDPNNDVLKQLKAAQASGGKLSGSKTTTQPKKAKK